MRLLVQRVTEASVSINSKVVGSIEQGFLVFIGIAQEDDEHIADILINKLLGLRIFADSEGKTNLSLENCNASILLVSQFTLYANCKKGNRPSFVEAALPDKANSLYDYILKECRAKLAGTGKVASGVFGADMKVNLVNDGPFTILLDSADLIK